MAMYSNETIENLLPYSLAYDYMLHNHMKIMMTYKTQHGKEFLSFLQQNTAVSQVCYILHSTYIHTTCIIYSPSGRNKDTLSLI